MTARVGQGGNGAGGEDGKKGKRVGGGSGGLHFCGLHLQYLEAVRKWEQKKRRRC